MPVRKNIVVYNADGSSIEIFIDDLDASPRLKVVPSCSQGKSPITVTMSIDDIEPLRDSLDALLDWYDREYSCLTTLNKPV